MQRFYKENEAIKSEVLVFIGKSTKTVTKVVDGVQTEVEVPVPGRVQGADLAEGFLLYASSPTFDASIEAIKKVVSAAKGKPVSVKDLTVRSSVKFITEKEFGEGMEKAELATVSKVLTPEENKEAT